MGLTLAPLFSGSNGNCTYIASDKAQILIDAGGTLLSVRQESTKAGISLNNLQGILITHEHSDHIKAAGPVSRKYDVPIYANELTWRAMQGKIGDIASHNVRIIGSEDFYIQDLCVQPFPTSHDAACSCGYTVTCKGSKVALMTDLGRVTADILEIVRDSRIVLLESNYDPDMLLDGTYPLYLKRRIASSRGHLSNPDAAKAAEQLVRRGVKGILLAHLSENNNKPALALATTRDYLASVGIVVGKHVALDVAKRGELTGVFHV